ncbi:unnamed protein product [Eruca vesicaria subsp. sativa]|uniref:UBX domain-containing protein n=1 Tax=Eruca vesicaria subsp. sativa TaxID=29727 RepID=A0ABC8J7G7_ERUVS|nr:unnamed protein product [Eruca vesicaria subsp. sativa]
MMDDDSHEEGREEQAPLPLPSIGNTPVQVCPEEISDSDSFESDSMTSDETQTISDYQQKLISSFTEIAAGQTMETAIEFLETTSWNLEEAINLFLVQGSRRSSSLHLPFLFQGSFDEAKSTSTKRNLWLLVNLQSNKEDASHSLNLDLWSNKVVSQAIESRIILWQVYDDTIQGKKISNFYKIESAPPVVLLIDPITGFMLRSWSGVIDAQSFVKDLMNYTVSTPHQYVASLTSKTHTSDHIETPSSGSKFEESETCSSTNYDDVVESVEPKTLPTHEEEETCLEYPALTEEPKGECDKSLVCSLCVRFPDGRRKQRRFLKSEPIQLLWSFCYSQMVESDMKAFKLVQAIPGASKTLEYGANATFEQSGLANSIVSVTWE